MRTVKYLLGNAPVPRLDAEILLGHLLNFSREQLLISSESTVSSQDAKKFMCLVERRARGEPVSYLIGKKAFFGVDFLVKPGVLIPRPESEHLVEEALQWISRQPEEPKKVFDFGCGSGCIGLSILFNTPDSKLTAFDKSPIACELTQENASRLGLKGRVTIVLKDLNTFPEELDHADVIVANPPYVSLEDPELDENVRKYEPAEALFSGENGFECIKKWKDLSVRLLRPGGIVLMEFGSSQGPKAKGIFASDACFENVKIGKDLSGHDRYVMAVRSS